MLRVHQLGGFGDVVDNENRPMTDSRYYYRGVQWIFLFLGVLLPVLVQGRHIIGGEMTYRCLGNDQYLFTMKVYRDCFGGGADFDRPATIQIYQQSPNGQVSPFRTLSLNIAKITRIPVEKLPCLELPPNLCVEEGVYEFQLSLPKNDASFHVVYQRCCRNNTITNILNPGDSGASFTVEVTAEARRVCNNSPTFNAYPPIAICAGNFLTYNHAATDVDGDQLVYQFCAPLLGGGKFGTPENPGNPSACDGVIPNDFCPPPYPPVIYQVPTYSASNPMGGNPQITINSTTGLITGVPNVLGQFVVGVCVSEFRNGRLLSVTQRDFQFNVAECNPTVLALVEYFDRPNANTFVIKSCGDSTVQIVNRSVQRSNITNFYWRFNIKGNTVESNEWSPTISFPDTGRYRGVLVLNENTVCGDTANIIIQIHPDIKADFNFQQDTCKAGILNFNNLSFSQAAGGITRYNWQMGDGRNASTRDVSHEYQRPGNYVVRLTVEDQNVCRDSLSKPVPYYPSPKEIIVAPDVVDGCAPQTVNFLNLSKPIDDTYDITWTFGDGSTGKGLQPEHLYVNPGIYDVSVTVVSPLGCESAASWNNLITVKPSPKAGFFFTPEKLSSFAPTVSITDASVDAIRWRWDLNGERVLTLQNPVYTFRDTGWQYVTQYVFHESGCVDSLTRWIDVEPLVTYFLPNAFTPNQDGLNEAFLGKGVLEGMQSFDMWIFNRYGEEVFATKNPDTGWNGRYNNSGRDMPQDVYVCKVRYVTPRRQLVEIYREVMLLR